VQSLLLGASGLRVSEACLGTGSFGEHVWGADRDECARIFDAYLEAGGRFIDVSNTYADGRSEAVLGELAAPRREELVIGTKYTASTRPGDTNAWGNHRKSLRQSLHQSLRRLRTDYVDILWVHSWDGLTPLDEIMRALDDEVSRGTVLYIGVSNTPAWATSRANTIAELRGWTRFVGLQAEYNLASRTPEHEQLPMARSLGLQVLPWSPLAGGVLAGGYADSQQVSGTRYQHADVPAHRLELAASVAEIAREIEQPVAAVSLAWLKHRPMPMLPILGARKVAQLLANLEYLQLKLSPEIVARLDAVSAPPPIMPGEVLDTVAGAFYFDAGVRASIAVPHA
jgi:aryl-alcohol dehydrogenase-like predicted oxidoreductase